MGKGNKKQESSATAVVEAPAAIPWFQLLIFVIATSALAVSVSIIYGLIPIEGRPVSLVSNATCHGLGLSLNYIDRSNDFCTFSH